MRIRFIETPTLRWGGLCVLLAGCDLNPQPLPPDTIDAAESLSDDAGRYVLDAGGEATTARWDGATPSMPGSEGGPDATGGSADAGPDGCPHDAAGDAADDGGPSDAEEDCEAFDASNPEQQ